MGMEPGYGNGMEEGVVVFMLVVKSDLAVTRVATRVKVRVMKVPSAAPLSGHRNFFY